MYGDALEAWKTLHFKGISPPTKCEVCGKDLPTMANAINLGLTVFVGSPGHPALAAFQCPKSQHQTTEHWACSIECWRLMAFACIESDMIPLIREGLERVHGDTSQSKEGIQ
jgi:hypothetical protein